MGNTTSIEKINFEDMQFIIKNPDSFLLINTLPINEQDCLIINTVQASQEEFMINDCLKKGTKQIPIVVYGKNCNDENLQNKYNQLASLGFQNIYVYVGGLFEWLMLQDIYGFSEFPTTMQELDFLKYRSVKILRYGFNSSALVNSRTLK